MWEIIKSKHKEDAPSKPTKRIPYYNYSSLSSMLPYQSYHHQTQLFHNETSKGFILEAMPLTGASPESIAILHTLLVDILPSGIDCQFLLWADPQVGSIYTDFLAQRHSAHTADVSDIDYNIIRWVANKRISFLRQGVSNSISENTTILLRDFKLYIIVSGNDKLPSASVNHLILLRKQIQSTLKSIHMETRVIDAEKFLQFLPNMCQPRNTPYKNSHQWRYFEPLNHQIFGDDTSVEVSPGHLTIRYQEGEPWQIRCFSVNEFPHHAAQWQMSENLGQLYNQSLQIECPFLISVSIRSIDRESGIQTSQFQTVNKSSKAHSPLVKFLPLAREEFHDWEFVRDQLQQGDALLKLHYQVILISPERTAEHCERKLLDLYRANGWRLQKVMYLQMQSWLTSMPMMISEGIYDDLKIFGRLRTLPASSVVNILPLQGEWKGSITPSLLFASRRGQIVKWDPFDNQDGNYNIAIAARSGSGKSVITQEYILSVLGRQGRVWVIDAGRSYEKTVRLLRGEFIVFSPEDTPCINVFTHIKDFEQHALPMLKSLFCIMARPESDVSREEANFIEQALQAAWCENANQTTVDHIVKWLSIQQHPIANNLTLLLHPYTKEGMYGNYFCGKCNINFDSPFIVLELQELKSKRELQKIVLFVMMFHITQAMYLGERTQIKSCVIDEAWDLLNSDNQQAAHFIETGYRTARRFKGNFVTITQSINDYYQNSTALAAYENSDHNLILAQKPETLTKLKESGRLELNEASERLFKSLVLGDSYSECIIKNNAGISLNRFILDPYSLILYSSKAEDYSMVKSLCEKGISLDKAISMIVKKKSEMSSRSYVTTEAQQ